MSLIVARIDSPALPPSLTSTSSSSIPILPHLVTHIHKQHHLAIPRHQWPPSKFTAQVRSYRLANEQVNDFESNSTEQGRGSRTMYAMRRHVEGQPVQDSLMTVLIEDGQAMRRSEYMKHQHQSKHQLHDETVMGEPNRAPSPAHFRHTCAIFPSTFEQVLVATNQPPPTALSTLPTLPRWTTKPILLSLDGYVIPLHSPFQSPHPPPSSSTYSTTFRQLPDWLIRVYTVTTRGTSQIKPWLMLEMEYVANQNLEATSPFLKTALNSVLPFGYTATPYLPTPEDLMDFNLPITTTIEPPPPPPSISSSSLLETSYHLKAGGTRRHGYFALMVLKREGLL